MADSGGMPSPSAFFMCACQRLTFHIEVTEQQTWATVTVTVSLSLSLELTIVYFIILSSLLVGYVFFSRS